MSVPTMFAVPKNLLFSIGLPSAENTFYQLPPDELINQCLKRNGGVLNDTVPLVINTEKFTGSRSKDRFIVKDKITESSVNWNDFNQPIEEKYFNVIYRKIIEHLREKEIWIRDVYVCTDPACRLNIRSINEDPASNLFAYNMFLPPTEEELKSFNPDWYIIHAPTFFSDPETDGTRQGNFTLISFTKKMILIGGPAYEGEGVFSILNFVLPTIKSIEYGCNFRLRDTAGTTHADGTEN